MIIYGKRGSEKTILRNLPCMHCDFIAEDIQDLGNHYDNKHHLLVMWSSTNLENQFYQIGKQSESEEKEEREKKK